PPGMTRPAAIAQAAAPAPRPSDSRPLQPVVVPNAQAIVDPLENMPQATPVNAQRPLRVAQPLAVAPAPTVQVRAPQPVTPAAKPAAETTPGAEQKRGIPWQQPVKIILGGILGLFLGNIVVYFLTGDDFTGILPSRKPPLQNQPVASRPVQPQAPRTNTSFNSPTPTQPAAPIPATPTPAENNLVPPPAPTSGGFNEPTLPANAAEPVGPPQTPASILATPSAPKTPVATPAAAAPTSPPPAVPAAPAGKQQPPKPDQQQKMLAELQTIYKAEFDRAARPDGRAGFVAFLRKTARELKTEPLAQFVLLRQAYDAAIGQQDFLSAADTIDDLEKVFEMDGFRLRQHLLTEASQAAKKPEERTLLIPFALDLADFAARAQRMEELPKLANIADSLARTTADKDLKAQVTARAIELRKAAADFAQVAAARKRLAEDPANPAASLIDGKFRCFLSGEWAAGLKLLAQCDHAALAAAAKLDLAGPSEAVKPAQIGDAWFDLGTADPALTLALVRAAHWYRQSAASAQGLEKVKLDKRLEEIAAKNLPAPSAADAAAPQLPSARSMLARSKTFERVDLLAALNDQTIRTSGWTVNPGYAHVSSADFARLQAPTSPTGEYQVGLRLRRTSSSSSQNGMFVIGLPHARSQFLLVLDFPIPGQGYASFLTLSNAKRPEDNPTFQLQAGQTHRLTTSREYFVACTVAPNQIQVLLDGESLINYQGDMNRLTMPREWSVPDARSLFLGSHQGSFSIYSWVMAPLRDASGNELPLETAPSSRSRPTLGDPRFNFPPPFSPKSKQN
ncbi:MAG TPA: hypothetical protein VFB80_13585, partial [Pirellulaceae bacterium]|nr:hypothetical protein [Pirellulaceae bacterium]